MFLLVISSNNDCLIRTPVLRLHFIKSVIMVEASVTEQPLFCILFEPLHRLNH